VFAITEARADDSIYLSKPLGTGIVTTALKYDKCTEEELAAAVASMSALNREACEKGLAAGVRCATDITGFGLAGHLFNVARASGVGIEIDSSALPLLPGVERLVGMEMLTGGARKNEAFLEGSLSFADGVPKWMREVVLDPQTSGGLALFSRAPIEGYPQIGRVMSGQAQIRIS
jgi:selenide,water dikinase